MKLFKIFYFILAILDLILCINYFIVSIFSEDTNALIISILWLNMFAKDMLFIQFYEKEFN